MIYLVKFLIILLTLYVLIIDLKFKIIPNKANIAILVLALAYSLSGSYINSLFGALLGFSLFLIIYLVTKGGLGEGDLKLIPSLGLIVGFPGIIDLIFISSLLSLPFGLMFLAKKKGKNAELPYAPFLVVSLYIVMSLKSGFF